MCYQIEALNCGSLLCVVLLVYVVFMVTEATNKLKTKEKRQFVIRLILKYDLPLVNTPGINFFQTAGSGLWVKSAT